MNTHLDAQLAHVTSVSCAFTQLEPGGSNLLSFALISPRVCRSWSLQVASGDTLILQEIPRSSQADLETAVPDGVCIKHWDDLLANLGVLGGMGPVMLQTCKRCRCSLSALEKKAYNDVLRAAIEYVVS